MRDVLRGLQGDGPARAPRAASGRRSREALADAAGIHAAFDADVLAVLDPEVAVRAKKSPGGTAPERVDEQIGAVCAAAHDLGTKAAAVPSLEHIRAAIEAEPL